MSRNPTIKLKKFLCGLYLDIIKYNSNFMSRNFLVKVYEDTKEKCNSGHYGNMKPGKSYLFTSDDSRLKSVKMERKYAKTDISVVNEDVLVVAESLATADNKLLTLNLASDKHPGGGVENGAMAQEEELFRRSNYFMFLPKSFYPINKTNVVYSPNVLVVKDSNYKELRKPFYTSMIAAAAIRHPRLNQSGMYDRSIDKQVMINTIENIFKTAYILGYDTLVMGALGCGAFGNPAIEVISIFNECLKKYDG